LLKTICTFTEAGIASVRLKNAILGQWAVIAVWRLIILCFLPIPQRQVIS
jgi:hypothetical protein